MMLLDADIMESLYGELNRRRYVHPDPLEFLYEYEDPADREVVALIAASLAYGRVRQILRSASAVLAELGPRPARSRAGSTRATEGSFRHLPASQRKPA